MSLLITDAGIAASIEAEALGVNYKITHIGIGLDGYVPTADQTQLKNEVAREALSRGSVPALGQLHFEAVFAGNTSFDGKEIGYFLEDGTLFAVDSRDGEIISLKRSNTIITESFELNLAGSSIKNITVELMGAPYATEELAGIAKITTIDKMNSDDDETIVTPKKLKDNTATDDDIDTESNEPKFIQLPQLWRGINTINSTMQFLAYDEEREYSVGEICFTKDGTTGELLYWQWYSNVESLKGKDPLDLNNRFVNWSNMNKPPYWIPFNTSKVGSTVWFGGDKLPEGLLYENNQNVSKIVYWRLALARPEIVVGEYIQIKPAAGRYVRAADGSDYISGDTHEDGIRNITGTWKAYSSNNSSSSGAVIQVPVGTAVTGGNAASQYNLEFDASRSVPTSKQNQPVTFIEWKALVI
ncbi:phage tail protein [Aliivibrio fischeri]|uniref:phage tail-collar fiber domain-containing protein n=1 Tax=Aliivibrio fischeri TaxID=668 RepID=UPI000B18673B|nr:phage tail protein [Aliivibrio fischeri]